MNNDIKKLNLDSLGFNNINTIYRNPSTNKLIQISIIEENCKVGMNGAIMVDTGKFTGRSPKDKYFVEEDSSVDKLWWGPVNKKVSFNVYNELYNKIINSFNIYPDNPMYIFDGFAGADNKHRLNVRIITKRAWQNHFCSNMFIKPKSNELNNFIPDFTIINASDIYNNEYKKHNLNSETFIIFNLQRKIAIIGGTEYTGEMKKGIFSVLHYLLPLKGILSMHCSANVDKDRKNTTLFFGLSGTGKTTLSTDPYRPLIGDDEHGWSDDGIFNFEGGCYAKAINLNKDEEPDIYNAIRYGALLENVCYDDETLKVDFLDSTKTENTRVSYPIEHIDNSLCALGYSSQGPHPKTIIFLTCDAYGILPPVSKLTSNQAMYHFISGYTAKIAGTERGINEPVATFSPCFGGPFLTLHPLKYAELLKEKINKYKSEVYLVNTGWIGGTPISGASRISIKHTRQIIRSILDGSINNSRYVPEPVFGLNIPKNIEGIESKILDPKASWKDPGEYDSKAEMLVGLFIENFDTYGTSVNHLKESGPKITNQLLM